MGNGPHDLDYLASVRISRSKGPEIEWTDNAGRLDSLHYSDDSDALYLNIGNDVYRLQAAYHRYQPGDFGTLGSHNGTIYISDVETFFADAGVTHPISDSLTAALNLTLNTFDWQGSNDGITFFERRHSQNLIIEPMLTYVPLTELNIILGGTYEVDEFGGRELFHQDREIYSLYSQVDYQLTDWLKPLIGIQYNKTPEVNGNTSHRFGVVMTPGKNWGVKLLYSEAFRRAFAAEAYLDSSFLLGNPKLKPETIETYEAQLNYQNSVCQVDLTYFYSRQEIIEVDFNLRPLLFINQPGYCKTEGIELTGRVNLGAHWQALGSAIAQTTQNETPEPFMDPNYPDYMIKAGLIGTFEALRLGLFNSYLSTGSIWHDHSDNLQCNLSYDASSWIGQKPDRLTLSLFADNLLGQKRYQFPSDVGQNEPIPHSYGRRLYATATLNW
jgi:outer membrane receptor protein involved in Fe transport